MAPPVDNRTAANRGTPEATRNSAGRGRTSENGNRKENRTATDSTLTLATTGEQHGSSKEVTKKILNASQFTQASSGDDRVVSVSDVIQLDTALPTYETHR